MSIDRIGIQTVPQGLQPLLSNFLRSVKVFLETVQPAKLPIYTAEQLNAVTVSQHSGELVRCSNGNAGNECLAYCDGTKWTIIPIGIKISSSSTDEGVALRFTAGGKEFILEVETPSYINDDVVLAFSIEGSPLRLYVADDPTGGGTRFYIWDSSTELPMLPHTGFRPTFAVYGDVLIGDIIALAANPMTYFQRTQTIDESAPTQIFCAKNGASDTDGGPMLVLTPNNNAGGAVNAGICDIIAYSHATGALANCIALSTRQSDGVATRRWVIDGQSASKGDINPLASDTYSIGSDSAPVKRIRVNEVAVTSTVKWTAGSGSPEGVVTAPIGSLYSRTDGGAGTSLYVKESGTGNTGWVGK